MVTHVAMQTSKQLRSCANYGTPSWDHGIMQPQQLGLIRVALRAPGVRLAQRASRVRLESHASSERLPSCRWSGP